MEAYKPPLEGRENFDGLRLDFNERLAPLASNITAEIKKFDPQRARLYPTYGTLRTKIANYAGMKDSQIMITNGSDQGMELIFRTYVKSKDKVIIPSPSFAMFYQQALIQGAQIFRPSYKKDGEFPFEEVMSLLTKSPKLLIICNPNNPTGGLLSLKKIIQILNKAPKTIVYIDEAYFEFSGVTVASLIEKYENLVITRTFSKAFGLAALRIGYLLSNPANISEMEKIRGPYDINQLAKIAAEAALDSLSNIRDYCNEVMSKAKPLVERFFRSENIEYFPSFANFIYFKMPGEKFELKLAQKKILIRPQGGGYARVTVGTSKQMKLFIKVFKEIIK